LQLTQDSEDHGVGEFRKNIKLDLLCSSFNCVRLWCDRRATSVQLFGEARKSHGSRIAVALQF